MWVNTFIWSLQHAFTLHFYTCANLIKCCHKTEVFWVINKTFTIANDAEMILVFYDEKLRNSNILMINMTENFHSNGTVRKNQKKKL